MDKADIYDTLNRAYFSDSPHEAEVISRLGRLLRGVNLAVDAGASLGQYTRAMSHAVPGIEIHAIEADPIRFEELSRNCEAWAAATGSRITSHHAALTSDSGEVAYYVTNSDVSGGLSKHDTPRPVEWDEIQVQALALDDLFPDRTPDFIKVDVEGAELMVLEGARRILKTGRPTILIELHDWDRGPSESTAKVERMLASYGYRRARFHGQDVFTRSTFLWARLAATDPVATARRAVRKFRRR